MTQWRWVLIGMVVSVFGGAALLARYLPDTLPVSPPPSVPPATPAPKRPSTPSFRQGFVLYDVYTSDAAAEKAYQEQLRAQAAAQAAAEEEPFIPETFAGLLDSLVDASESTPPVANEPEWTPHTTEPTPPLTPSTLQLRREVQSLVERFLRDAFNARDADAYLAALDEDFRYTYDAGTPDNPDDDRSYRGRGYEAIGIHRVFERYTEIESELSPPRGFQLLRPDAAQVTYDYDISLRNARESRRIGGTATFLVMRGGSSGDTNEWRIVEWYDVPLERPVPR